MDGYTVRFYDELREGAYRSARVIVPIVLDLVRPRSLVDIGCGAGAWLAVFREHGVDEILGIDGAWVDRGRLEIPPDRFREADLTQALRLDREFDLAVSLEVAEHLPPQCADTFVGSLVSLAPCVLFSAAIPFQGGVHHVNEQWPEYWVERFQRHGYRAVDCIRKRIWGNTDVEYCYAQNTLLFARRDYLDGQPALKEEYECASPSLPALVHPRKYLEAIDWMRRWVDDAHVIAGELAALVPPAATFILVDQGEFGILVAGGRTALPFVEREGQYWGPPADDREAVQEVERLRRRGASFMVFARPAFWWLEHYGGLRAYLHARFRCAREHERLIAFDLRR